MLIKKLIPFILCVILLIPLFGCSNAENTVVESASAPVTESSKPSKPNYDTEPPIMEGEEEKIDYANREPAYSIEPLDEPKNGAMTYEEFFAEERFVQDSDFVYIENAPDDIVADSDLYNGKLYIYDVKDGYLNLINKSEIWWYSYDFTERLLIYRAQEYDEIIGMRAYDNIAILHLKDSSTTNTIRMYRIYLPTFEIKDICSFYARMLDVYSNNEYLGHSTTTFRMDSYFTNPIGALVYCELEDTVYFTKNFGQVDDKGVWEEVQRQKALGIFIN